MISVGFISCEIVTYRSVVSAAQDSDEDKVVTLEHYTGVFFNHPRCVHPYIVVVLLYVRTAIRLVSTCRSQVDDGW